MLTVDYSERSMSGHTLLMWSRALDVCMACSLCTVYRIFTSEAVQHVLETECDLNFFLLCPFVDSVCTSCSTFLINYSNFSVQKPFKPHPPDNLPRWKELQSEVVTCHQPWDVSLPLERERWFCSTRFLPVSETSDERVTLSAVSDGAETGNALWGILLLVTPATMSGLKMSAFAI